MADLTTLLSKFLQNLSLYSGGVSGALQVGTTAVGTDAATSEKDLWASYSIPANTLSANGKAVKIRVTITTAANAQNKTARLYVGGTKIIDTGARAVNNGQMYMEATIVRTGVGTQSVVGPFFAAAGIANATLDAVNALTLDETTALAVRVTGQNGTASANDMVFRVGIVELLN